MRPLMLLVLAACGHQHLPDPDSRPGETFFTDVAMRDGIDLKTRVFLPRGDGPWPTVFMRAPYPMGVILNDRCRTLNRYGYACAWQFVRGRGGSGGTWSPFVNEPADGKDALTWLVAQGWVDGNVALWGESYLGAVQWAVAADLPPEVKTMIPTVVGTEMYDVAFEEGLLRHELVTAWMSLMPDDRFRFVGGGPAGYHRALKHRPRRDLDVVATGEELPWFRAWIEADRRSSPFWGQDIAQIAATAPERTAVPVLMIGGWADAFLGPQLETWRKLATRSESTLVVGPWHHLGFVAADVPQGKLDDRIGLAKTYVQWPRVLDWLDHHLKGEPAKYPIGAVITWPVNGDGWVQRDAWPPPTRPRTLALSMGDDPQRCTGSLGDDGGGAVMWTYDPADPTASVGGAGLLAGVLVGWRGIKPGFVNQGRLCERRDDLVGFRSGVLAADLHVAGNLTASIRFRTTAPDSALNVRFLEERPTGKRIMVRESILQVSRRDGEATTPYSPGEIVTMNLETWPVEYVFEAGSRVVVELASASFPKYEAHANSARSWLDVVETSTADQTVYLTGSHVTLPVIAP